ncbi:lipocalin family protein [Pelagicoccus albus]|uniref:Lipocalin family protein n=1 Tax=Pelagicoccus albus TaxID=415222 RepID=A0A7X1BBH9_9BACT|nr:lipocalin family protein [Pelagicoccus albus]MBC2607993.1 lipocalin family protein [Pelagicoccus albus]
MKRLLIALTLLATLLTTACSENEMPNQKLADSVNLESFMGTWYVHGHTPTFMDKEAYDATETYELDGKKIRTTYRYRKGSHEGKWKEYHPVGKVYDHESNAEWRMRFFGILNAAYYILYVDPSYEYTVVGHPGRSMAWIMSRSPQMTDSKYDELIQELVSRDYDLSELRRLPHQAETKD